jgi:hypothetical protein
VNQVAHFEMLDPSEIAETSREGYKAGQPGSAKAALRVQESSSFLYNPTSFLSSPASMSGIRFDALDWPSDTPNHAHQHSENNTVAEEISGFTFPARALIALLVPLQLDYFFSTRNQHNICHSNKQTVLARTWPNWRLFVEVPNCIGIMQECIAFQLIWISLEHRLVHPSSRASCV